MFFQYVLLFSVIEIYLMACDGSRDSNTYTPRNSTSFNAIETNVSSIATSQNNIIKNINYPSRNNQITKENNTLYSLRRKMQFTDEKDEALYLTPLIESGQIEQAQQLAGVSIMEGVKSFSGYITVNKTAGSNLFFWLFQTQQGKFEKRPLIVWLSGGNAVAGLYGLFRNVGPFYVGNDDKLQRRKYSWNLKYNLVFVDSPVGAGYSFTESESGYPLSKAAVVDHLYTFLVQLHKLFPSLKRNKLIVAGESLGTFIAALLAHKIHEENKVSDFFLNLKGLVLASKPIDPGMSWKISSLLFDLGAIDENQRQELSELEEDIFVTELSGNATQAAIATVTLCKRINTITGFKSALDFVQDDITLNQKKAAAQFLQQSATKRALHVGKKKWTDHSEEAAEHFLRSKIISVKPYLESLLTAGSLPILAVTGQRDIARVIRGELFDSYEWPQTKEYFRAKRCQFKVGDEVAGYYKTAGPLTDALLRNSGHTIAASKPRWAFKLIDRFITDEKYFRCT